MIKLPGFSLHIILVIGMLVAGSTPDLRAQSGIFAGGPAYYGRDYSIRELKTSGFTYVIVWTIHIDRRGNFNFNAEFPLVQNGQYVGDAKYPHFASDMAALKTAPTSIRRVEFGLSAWQSSTFDNVRDLINSQGTGPNTLLYRNFQALKNAIPAVDALSFDDEKTYDAPTATALTLMLGELGFQVTLCPYTAADFWTSVASHTNRQRSGTIDRVDLQCYAGGASNQPCEWNFGSIPVHTGLWSKEKTPSQVQSQLTTWKEKCSVGGGFMWLYDDFDQSNLVKQYAAALNNVVSQPLGIEPLDNRLVELYPNPATDQFNIRVPKRTKIENATLYNVSGKPVPMTLATTADGYRVQASHVPAGLYCLQVRTTRGTFTKRVILE